MFSTLNISFLKLVLPSFSYYCYKTDSLPALERMSHILRWILTTKTFSNCIRVAVALRLQTGATIRITPSTDSTHLHCHRRRSSNKLHRTTLAPPPLESRPNRFTRRSFTAGSTSILPSDHLTTVPVPRSRSSNAYHLQCTVQHRNNVDQRRLHPSRTSASPRSRCLQVSTCEVSGAAAMVSL